MRKEHPKMSSSALKILFSLLTVFLMTASYAQDSTAVADSSKEATETPIVKKKSYVRNTFSGRYLIDEQTASVPIKGTLEADIQHRFGLVNTGIKDLYGIFATAMMRIAFSYVPVNNLEIGFGANNYNTTVDGSIKYAILKQTTDNSIPVAVTYFGSVAMDTRKLGVSPGLQTSSDRFSYFNQILVARKFSEALSVQVGGDFTHWNSVEGYYASPLDVQPQTKNTQFAFSVGGRIKISPQTSIVVDYDQPVTQNAMNNPHPNLALGFDFKTSGHDFQIFAGNYSYTLPQLNRMFNTNDFTKGQFLIGFNISRLWNF